MHDFVETFLQSRRHIAMLIGDFIFGPAFVNKVVFKILSRSCVILPFVSRTVQSQYGNVDRAVRKQSHCVFEKSAKTLRISIRGEPHDFVLVGIEVETQVKSDQRIENANGILRGNFA
jgi:hypothetical protein